MKPLDEVVLTLVYEYAVERSNYKYRHTLSAYPGKYFLRPEKKYTYVFFALRALQFWEMALLFCFYLEKFGFNIFPDLKSKQIK
jgi:hypothetical protein